MPISLETLIDEALGYEAEAFDNDEYVSGADLVDWFDQWRTRAKTVRNSVVVSSPQPSCCITPADLREAIDALNEAAETRRNVETDAKRETVHRLIADIYDHTARKFAGVRRILERDQAVLCPTRSGEGDLQVAPRFQIVMEDGIVSGVRIPKVRLMLEQMPSFVVREYESDGSLDQDHVTGIDHEGREYYDHEVEILEPED